MTDFKRKLFVVISVWFALAAAQTTSAYSLLSSQPPWSQDLFDRSNPDHYTFNIYGGLPADLEDRQLFEDAYRQSMEEWAGHSLIILDYHPEYRQPAATNPDGTVNCDSSIGFDDQGTFGDDLQFTTLAVAQRAAVCASGYTQPDGGFIPRYIFRPTDITFNSAREWDVYDGPITSDPVDFRRVALHEIGHLFGLDHPDEAVPPQTVTAIMISYVSDTNMLQTDDIAGLRALYGHPPAQEVAASNGISVNRIEVTWSSVPATSEYRVLRVAGVSDNVADYTQIATVAAPSYTDEGLDPGELFSYKILACISAVNGPVCSDDSPTGVGYTALSTPANVTASDGISGYVAISWDTVDGAAHYRLYRSSAPQDIGSVIASPTNPRFRDSGTAPGVASYYRVQACADFTQIGEQCFSVSSADLGYQQLSKPANVKATAGDSTDYIRVSWDAVIGADNYLVLRSTERTTASAYGHIAAVTAPIYDDAEATAGQRFYYRIQACVDGVADQICSAESNPTGGGYRDLSVPTNVAASDDNTYSIHVTWDAVDDADGYCVYRLEGTNLNIRGYTQLTEMQQSPEIFDGQPAPGELGIYQIQACGANCIVSSDPLCSGLSEAAIGLKKSTLTSAEASQGISFDYIDVTWDGTANAASYLVYRAVDFSSDFEMLSFVTNTTYRDLAAAPGSIFYYRVRACANDDGTECPEVFSGTAAGWLAFSTPTNVQASQGTSDDFIRITWDNTTGTTSHRVYRSATPTEDFNDVSIAADLTHHDNEAIPGITFYYRVRACFTDDGITVCSGPSDTVAGWRNLSAPTNVTASQGDSTDHIEVTWNDAVSAASYLVYRSATQTDSFNLVSSVTDTMYRDAAATPGITFDYRVRACSNNDGTGVCSDPSDAVSGWRNPFAAPTSVTASQGDSADYVEVTWDKTTDAASYLVYRADSLTDDFVTLAAVVDTVHRDITATPGITFYYRVRACSDNDGTGICGLLSDAAAGWRNLSAPTDVTASQGDSADHIEVTWDGAANAESYLVYRSAVQTDSFKVVSIAADLFYRDASTTPGITFYYRIRACSNNDGTGVCSNPSDAASGWRNPFAAPTNIVASQGDSADYIEVTWNNIIGAASYLIYRSATQTDSFNLVSSVTDTMYRDAAATPGITFYYRVRACSNVAGAGICGLISDAVAGWRNPLSAPTNIVASQGISTDYIEVTWDKTTGAASYLVYRADSLTGGFITVSTATNTMYRDFTVAPGITLYYRTRACPNADGTGICGVLSDAVAGWRNLSAPTNVTASQGDSTSHIEVAWNDTTGAASYLVYRSTTQADSFDAVFTVTDLVYRDTAATPGITFYYRIRACSNVAGTGICGISSDAVAGWRNLSAPTNVTASQGDNTDHIEVTWDDTTGAESYLVYRSAAQTGSFEAVSTVTHLIYRDIDATPGITFHYRVRACSDDNGIGVCSSLSDAAAGWRNLSAPTNVTASQSISTDYIEVAWDDTTGAASYLVYRSVTQTGSFDAVSTVADLVYRDAEATPGATFYYRVRACSNGDGTGVCSDLSDAAAGWRNLSAPTDVTASRGDSTDYIEVAWDDALGAENYLVYRSATQTDSFDLVSSVTDTMYRDTAATPGITFYYRVRACFNAGGVSVCSDPSDAVSGWRNPFPAPTNVTASQGDSTDYIEVAWDDTTGAASYLIFRAESLTGSFIKLSTTMNTMYRDAAATPGITFYYRVRACPDADGAGVCGGLSNAAAGWRNLSSPTNVTASQGDSADYIEVAWDNTAGAASYLVYRSAATQTDSFNVVSIAAAATYRDTAATPGITFYYRVRACSDADGNGICGGLSNIAAGWRNLSSPTNVTASQGDSADHIEVTWDNTTGAASYLVHRSAAQTNSFDAVSAIADLVYRDTEAAPGITFYYRVRACSNDSGTGVCGGLSNIAAGWRNLSSPTNVTASQGISADHIEVTWDNTTGAASYLVYRSAATQTGSFDAVSAVADLVYRDTEAAPGITFYYRVRACSNDSGTGVCGGLSNIAAGWRNLSSPTDVTASQGDSADYIEVAWDDTTGAASYLVYRSAAQTNSFDVVSAVADLIYRDAEATPGITFYYRIRACSNDSGTGVCGGLSNIAAGWRNLSSPTNVTASQGISADHIEVTWDNTTGAASYLVYRSAATQTGSFDAVSAIADLVYRDAEATPGATFYYRIRACSDDDGTGVCGSLSNAASGWRNLSTPTDITASQGDSADYIEVTWDDTAGAASYLVYRSVTQTGSFDAVSAVADLLYRDAEATPGATFYYRIRACSGDGGNDVCGSVSDAVAGWRKLSSPTNVQASDGASTDRVVISWDYVWGAFDYHIQRSSTKLDGYSELAAVTALSYDDTEDFGVHVFRYYRLQACSALGCSAYSSPARGHRGLSAPTNVVVSDEQGAVRVTWEPVPDAEFYAVYRSASESPFALVDGEISFYIDENAGNRQYSYSVRACTGSKDEPICGSFSEADAGGPGLLRFYIRVFLEGAQ